MKIFNHEQFIILTKYFFNYKQSLWKSQAHASFGLFTTTFPPQLKHLVCTKGILLTTFLLKSLKYFFIIIFTFFIFTFSKC